MTAPRRWSTEMAVRRTLGIVALLLVGTALVACEDEPDETDVPTYAVGEGDHYVAIGDSYTAAPGTGTYSEWQACQQSVVNYPHQIASATGVELTDNSCNGANTSNVSAPQKTKNTGKLIRPPQLKGLDEETDLVTFRLGANDYNLIGGIFTCALVAARGGFGDQPHPCTDLAADAEGGGPDELLDDVATNVENALATISDHAPDAKIIVIGYPQILPAEGACPVIPLPEGDTAWARGLIDGFNDALRAGAETVDATYIDMFEASAGHHTCSDDPWMAGIRVEDGGTVPWHPYHAETEAVAELVLAELKQ